MARKTTHRRRQVRRPKTLEDLLDMRYYRAVVLAEQLGIENPLQIKPPARLKELIAERLELSADE